MVVYVFECGCGLVHRLKFKKDGTFIGRSEVMKKWKL